MSIAENGILIDSIDYDNGYSHAENLHVFVKELLEKNKIDMHQLAAIAVSKGPGSYTGLRIGVSAAKGFSYALNIPLISVDTLQSMTIDAIQKMPNCDYYCPMLDARRMEVYMGIYNRELIIQKDVEAFIMNEHTISQFKNYHSICFFGNGFSKGMEILNKIEGAQFIDNIAPSAKSMVDIAFQKYRKDEFEDVSLFEPFYLKDFLILGKK